MTADRDALARIIHAPIGKAFDDACPDWWPDTLAWATEAADAIIAAGWRYDGSCRDCQANLDTNNRRIPHPDEYEPDHED